MKLFRVNTRALPSSTGTDYSSAYVVAPDPTAAYEIVRKYLDEKGVLFQNERTMAGIELLAEEGDYPECRTMLFIDQ